MAVYERESKSTSQINGCAGVSRTPVLVLMRDRHTAIRAGQISHPAPTMSSGIL